MKICKICKKEITNKKKLVYCSDECVYESKLINNKNKNIAAQIKYKTEKESWNFVEVKIGKVKHNKTIPLNNINLTNSIKTHLKLLLRENNLSTKEYVKIKRLDGVVKSCLMVVVTPNMIKKLFNKKYEAYKENFRYDCLKTVKTLAKIFDIVNEYDFEKAKNAK